MTAESLAEALGDAGLWLLQWGRGRMTAESHVVADTRGLEEWLQWGRGRMTAESAICERYGAGYCCFNGAAVA